MRFALPCSFMHTWGVVGGVIILPAMSKLVSLHHHHHHHCFALPCAFLHS
jgi:hypothetical protein